MGAGLVVVVVERFEGAMMVVVGDELRVVEDDDGVVGGEKVGTLDLIRVPGYDSCLSSHQVHHRRIADGVVDNVDDNVPVDQHSDSMMLSPSLRSHYHCRRGLEVINRKKDWDLVRVADSVQIREGFEPGVRVHRLV